MEASSPAGEPTGQGGEIEIREPTGLRGEIRIQEPDRGQRAIARRTAEIRATIPDLELEAEVDIGAALALAKTRGVGLSALLVRATALALREHPSANGAYRDGRFELYSRVNVGFVVHTPGSYVTPTVLDADTKSPEQLTEELERIGARARAGELTSPELAGATFTLSDFSELGVDRWSTLVTPPHAGALTAGAIRTVPTLREGTVVPGARIKLTLGCDHRILFGAQAAAFLRGVVGRLERAQL